MDATDWIAIYAAVVSTVGVGWQILKEWRAQRPQVEVRTYIGMLAFPTGMRPALQIEARNRSDHQVRVASAGFNVQDNSGHVLAIFSDQPGATIPGVIPARDSGMEKLDPNRPVIAWVSLATGERINSKPVTLRKPG